MHKLKHRFYSGILRASMRLSRFQVLYLGSQPRFFIPVWQRVIKWAGDKVQANFHAAMVAKGVL